MRKLFTLIIISFLSQYLHAQDTFSYSKRVKDTFSMNYLFFVGQEPSRKMRSPMMYAHQFCRDKGYFRGKSVETKNRKITRMKREISIVQISCTNSEKLGLARDSFNAIKDALPDLNRSKANLNPSSSENGKDVLHEQGSSVQ